jgi:hypothetical protein
MRVQLILAAALGLTAFGSAHAQILPPIKAATLNKQPISWPAGLPAARTILMIAFDRKQQSQIDGWVVGLQLKAANAPSWFEVPLIKNPGRLVRTFIDSGMRRGIPITADRAHVVTVYGDKKRLMAAMGISNEAVIHIIVVERSGRIVQRASGAFNPASAGPILAAVRGN